MILQQLLVYISTLLGVFLLFSSTVDAVRSSRAQTDVLNTYRLSNHYQCQRLCWYTRKCKRFSFDRNGNSGGADNCFLHARTAVQDGDLVERWIVHSASNDGLTPSHGCYSRLCNNTSICIPGKGQHSTICGQIPIEGTDECATSPCQNQGTCTSNATAYTCTCPAGYSGLSCETDVNECIPGPCQNGGICTDLVNGYACTCLGGFTGDHCETDVNECIPGPCQNGGTCTDFVNGYACTCLDGFTGDHCETDIDECATDRCQNGGNCTDQVNGYACECPAGYTGVDCETGTWLESGCTDQCPWPNTTCLSGKCVCQPDQYFSHSKYTCTSEVCTTFHADRYIRYDNHDLEGHDLATVNINDSDKCKLKCSEHKECRAFVYMPQSQWSTFCFLKSASIVDAPKVCSTFHADRYIRYDNHDLEGHDLATVNINDSDKCKLKCSEHKECRAFVYMPQSWWSTFCFLKDASIVDVPSQFVSSISSHVFQRTCV